MRKRKQDWLDTGLSLLGETGLDSLTIQAMSSTLNVTKGSFYHHFKNMRDFELQLLGHWESQYQANSGPFPTQPQQAMALLDTLMQETFSPITGPEIAIRMWAQQSETARPFVERVDRLRYQFLQHIFTTVTGDPQQANLMAGILFTIAIGSMTALPRISAGRVHQLYLEFKRLYRL